MGTEYIYKEKRMICLGIMYKAIGLISTRDSVVNTSGLCELFRDGFVSTYQVCASFFEMVL